MSRLRKNDDLAAIVARDRMFRQRELLARRRDDEVVGPLRRHERDPLSDGILDWNAPLRKRAQEHGELTAVRRPSRLERLGTQRTWRAAGERNPGERAAGL